MRRADRVADRIQTGIDLLSEPDVLEAFRIANRVTAAAARPRPAGASPKGVRFALRIVIRGADLVIASPRSGAAGEVAT